jgi:hypothetical protein
VKDKAADVHQFLEAVTRKEYFLMEVGELQTEMAIQVLVDPEM